MVLLHSAPTIKFAHRFFQLASCLVVVLAIALVVSMVCAHRDVRSALDRARADADARLAARVASRPSLFVGDLAPDEAIAAGTPWEPGVARAVARRQARFAATEWVWQRVCGALGELAPQTPHAAIRFAHDVRMRAMLATSRPAEPADEAAARIGRDATRRCANIRRK